MAPRHAAKAPPPVEQSPRAEPSIAAKAAHCHVCDRRFVPEGGAAWCPGCVAADRDRRQARAGFTKCRVLANVVSMGLTEDGAPRVNWAEGDVGEFADHDVLGSPDMFEPL